MGKKAMWTISGLLITYIYGWILFNFAKVQGDFWPYWAAIRAFCEGLNPYVMENLTRARGAEMNLPYIYTPLPLVFFYPFSLLPFSAAAVVYFIVKSAACLQLLKQWLSHWVQQDRHYFVIFALAAYNRAIWGDLVQGNIVLFEQVMLWAAFWSFLNKRWGWFAVEIALASFFKVVPLIFLSLVIFTADRKAYLYSFIAGLITLIANGLSFYLSKLPVQDWLNFFSVTPPTSNVGVGRSNPSLQSFLKDLELFFNIPYANWVFFLLVAIMGGITLWVLLRQKGAWEKRALNIVLLACFASSFAFPVFRGYNFIILILPTWYVWTVILKKDPVWLTLAFLILDTYIPMTALNSLGMFWQYSPLFIALSMWVSYIRYLYRENLLGER